MMKETKRKRAKENDQQNNSKPIKKSRKKENFEADETKALGYLNEFGITLTGARVGEIIVGKHSCNKNCIVRIHNCTIPPVKNDLDVLRAVPSVWAQFLLKLQSIPFFASMETNEERENWLTVHQSDAVSNDDTGSRFIGEDCKVKLEIIQIGEGKSFTTLEQSDFDNLLANNDSQYWFPHEIENFFPRKSSAKHPTLIFIKHLWHISSLVNTVSRSTPYSGLVICGETGKRTDVVNAYPDSKLENWYIVKINTTTDIVISVPLPYPSNAQWQKNEDCIIETITYMYHTTFSSQEIKDCMNAYRYLTPAAFKSLIQKIIRFRPNYVSTIDNKMFKSELALMVAVCMLINQPATFIPDIQRAVTGLEAATKRLVVIAFEDAWPDQDTNKMLSLLTCSLLSQRVRTWTPLVSMVRTWLTFALACLHSERVAKWSAKTQLTAKNRFHLSHSATVLQCCSALLNELRSFAGDLSMAHDIALKDSKTGGLQFIKTNEQLNNYSITMPVHHFVDHHCFTSYIYYCNPSIIESMCTDTSKAPLSPIFSYTWQRLCSINPRRPERYAEDESILYRNVLGYSYASKETPDDSNVKEIRKAQQMYLMSRQVSQTEREVLPTSSNYSYTLHSSWLAALVGHVPVKKGIYVIINTSDNYQFKVMRKPSRNMKKEPLEEDDIYEAIEECREIFRTTGVPLNAAHSPHESLKSKWLYLVHDNNTNEERYKIGSKNKKDLVDWESARVIDIQFPLHPSITNDYFNIETAICNWGKGIEVNADESLERILCNTPIAHITRAASFLTGYQHYIEMNTVSRDGGGVKEMVQVSDIGAFRLLLAISILYPCALRPVQHQPCKFVVPYGPVLWIVRDRINQFIFNAANANNNNINGFDQWTGFVDSNKRVNTPYQEEAIKEYKEDYEKQFQTHNIIDYPVGSGKTRIIIECLKYMNECKRLPMYVVYTLPSEAMNTVINEMLSYGLMVNVVNPCTTVQDEPIQGVQSYVNGKVEFKPFHINVIKHHYLHQAVQELVSIAPNLMFIVDELHKTMHDTKRTSSALSIAKLSSNFIGLTGTLVVDSKMYKLQRWLQMIAPFEITNRNFFVAWNCMISSQFKCPVEIIDQIIEIPFSTSPKLLSQYEKCVSTKIGGKNPNPTSQDFRNAIKICWELCEQEMIQKIKNILYSTDELVARGVLLVVNDVTEQEIFRNKILNHIPSLTNGDIFLITPTSTIDLTQDNVLSGTVHPYKIVITTIKKCAGYNMTWFGEIITSVYPCSEPDRSQIRHRLARLGQQRKEIIYTVLHCGILTRILQNHNDCRNYTEAFNDLKKQFEF